MYSPKNQDTIFAEMKAAWLAEPGGADLTNWTTHSMVRILVWVISGALSYLYRALSTVLSNIFPATADHDSLYWWLISLGGTYTDQTEEELRSEVGDLFTAGAIGTGKYYEQSIVKKYVAVDRVVVTAGYKQANGLLLFCTSNGQPVAASVLSAIQAYYDAPERHAVGQKLFVETGQISLSSGA